MSLTPNNSEKDYDPLQPRLGRDQDAEELNQAAETLSWVIPNVFIMPQHEYVVESALQNDQQREAFRSLQDACTHHPKRWRAFFRAYKARNSYIEAGEYRYWYSQVGAAKMMNRSYREIEIENIRVAQSDKAVKNWTGSAYAWKYEYGTQCENLHRYCNLIMLKHDTSKGAFSIVRYAAMVSRKDVKGWAKGLKAQAPEKAIGDEIRKYLAGASFISGVRAANSKHVSCTDEEMRLKAVWMAQKDMSVERVATDLRWYSTAPSLEVEQVYLLKAERSNLIQLSVPPA